VDHIPHVVLADLQQRCDVPNRLTLGGHQDHDRAANPDRVLRRPGDALKLAALVHRQRPHEHAAERPYDGDEVDASTASERSEDRPLLRYRNGRPITVRRYDYLWNRVGQHLPWAATQGITAHWLRHTTLTWVERNFGYAVARAYAGHEGGLAGAGVTATYVRADLDEVAAALSALTAEPHPLAQTTAGAGSGPTIGGPPTWW
jgi:integrase